MRFVPGHFLPPAFLTTQPTYNFSRMGFISVQNSYLKHLLMTKHFEAHFLVRDWEGTAGCLQEQMWGLFIAGVSRASAVMLWVNASFSSLGQDHGSWGQINPSPLATEIQTRCAPANDHLHQLSPPEILFKGLVWIHIDSESGPEDCDSETTLNF